MHGVELRIFNPNFTQRASLSLLSYSLICLHHQILATVEPEVRVRLLDAIGGWRLVCSEISGAAGQPARETLRTTSKQTHLRSTTPKGCRNVIIIAIFGNSAGISKGEAATLTLGAWNANDSVIPVRSIAKPHAVDPVTTCIRPGNPLHLTKQNTVNTYCAVKAAIYSLLSSAIAEPHRVIEYRATSVWVPWPPQAWTPNCMIDMLGVLNLQMKQKLGTSAHIASTSSTLG